VSLSSLSAEAALAQPFQVPRRPNHRAEYASPSLCAEFAELANLRMEMEMRE
jgi:hypothetical protein